MPNRISVVMVAEPDHARGQFVLLRKDPPNPDCFVWCGRSLGWLPLTRTSAIYQHLFSSREEADQATDKAMKLPLQE